MPGTRIKIILFAFLLFTMLSKAQTANWAPMGAQFFPANISGQIHGISRISQLKFHPSNSSKMYAVSARGGLFISTNGGNSWNVAPGTDLMPSMRLSSVCIDHTNNQIIYLGTGDHNYYFNGSGIYKSVNGGATFAATTLTGKLVVEILMDPSDHNVIIAATNVGIYKTINGGTSWTLKSANVPFDDMVFKRSNSARTIYAATASAFYRSSDFGETWSVISSGLYIPAGYSSGGGCRIAVTPQDTSLVYFAMVAKNGTIFKSTNGANSFTVVKDSVMPNLTGYDNIASSVGQGDYNFAIGIDPTNVNTVYLVAHNVWKSTNGGAAWTQLTIWSEKVHTDMHQIMLSTYNTSQLWNMNDGGVWLSTDGGNNWVPKSDGIYGYEIYHGSCSPTRKDMVSIGTQDNGELYYAGNTWYCNRGGDWGSNVAFDYSSNSSTAYYYGSAKRRNVITGGENSFNLPFSSLQDIAFHRGQPNLAFAANNDVYRTINLSVTNPTWTKITNINKTIMAVHVSTADSNRLYVITNDQTLYVSTNALAASPTFNQYALPFGTNNVASITTIKNTPNTLYAVFNTRVYRSIDNGANWTNISSNLPSVNYVKIISDEYFSSTELVFVAGNNSVYYKKAGQGTWTLFSTNLPTRTTINDLSIYDDGTKYSLLRVTEYGRGVWETGFGTLRPLGSAFIADIITPCAGQNVQFSDCSTGTPVSWSWSFAGGSPSTSTAQNPVVTYSAAGNYNVALTVGDGTTFNTLTKTAYVSSAGQLLPHNQGFESQTFPPLQWINIDGGSDSKVWQRTTAASGFGTSTASMYFDNYNIDSQGNYDEIQTPKLDLFAYSNAKLYFDVAYQPYSTTTYIDSLQVLVSANCGASFNPVYTKTGNTLSTVSGVNTSNFVPTAAQWRRDSIDLTPYTGLNNVIISFRNIGYYGNNLYIDNVNVTGVINSSTLNLSLWLEAYYTSESMRPALMNQGIGSNPDVVDTITVELHNTTTPYAKVYSTKAILMTNGTATASFPLSALNGTYYIVVKQRNSIETWSKSTKTFNNYSVSYKF